MPRIIPCLLMNDGGFVKTRKFKKPDYIGDPVNVINLFNRFEVDEIIILDITATNKNRCPDFDLISDLANECWVPLAYGGGLNNMEDVKKIFSLGIEKIILNSAAYKDHGFVQEVINIYGTQAVVASVDIGLDLFGKKHAYTNSGKNKIKLNYMDYLKSLENMGFGEIFINFIYKDGMWSGFDNNTIESITASLNVPVIACGGANTRRSLVEPLSIGASAVAAGSIFVYKKQGEGVLINYPERAEIEDIFRMANI